jgi:hypothetical protein
MKYKPEWAPEIIERFRNGGHFKQKLVECLQHADGENFRVLAKCLKTDEFRRFDLLLEALCEIKGIDVEEI